VIRISSELAVYRVCIQGDTEIGGPTYSLSKEKDHINIGSEILPSEI